MKKILIPFVALLLLLGTVSCNQQPQKVVLSTQQDTLSWAMGMSLAETAKSDFYNFDVDLIRQAFESSLNGEKQPLDPETFKAACGIMSVLLQQQQQQVAQNSAATGDQRQKEYFDKLTAENPNIQKSPQGFYYQVLTPGSGPKAKSGQRIKFDFCSFNALTGDTITQTYGHRDPIVHVISNSMFMGLFHGLQLMPAGSKYRFYFPYETCRNVDDLPQYTPVIYEVELHEIFKD